MFAVVCALAVNVMAQNNNVPNDRGFNVTALYPVGGDGSGTYTFVKGETITFGVEFELLADANGNYPNNNWVVPYFGGIPCTPVSFTGELIDTNQGNGGNLQKGQSFYVEFDVTFDEVTNGGVGVAIGILYDLTQKKNVGSDGDWIEIIVIDPAKPTVSITSVDSWNHQAEIGLFASDPISTKDLAVKLLVEDANSDNDYIIVYAGGNNKKNQMFYLDGEGPFEASLSWKTDTFGNLTGAKIVFTYNGKNSSYINTNVFGTLWGVDGIAFEIIVPDDWNGDLGTMKPVFPGNLNSNGNNGNGK